jgi:hypothetical protein
MRARGARPIPGCFHNRRRAKELKKRLSSQITKKSKRVENTLELVLFRTIQTWMEIKSIQDYDEQERIKEA